MADEQGERPVVPKGHIGSPAGASGAKVAVAMPVARMFAIVDAVVAIAMTIILLDIRIPPGLEDETLRDALYSLVPEVLAFALSVAVIGWFWHSHHVVMRHAARIDTMLLWLNFAFLGLVSLIPFPTSVLDDYPGDPVGPALYAGVIALAAFVQALMWLHLTRRNGPAIAPISGDTRLRLLATPLIVTIVFLASVPVAFVAPKAAIAGWFAVPLLTVGFLLARRRRAAAREGRS